MIWLFLSVLLLAVMLALASWLIVLPLGKQWLALQERKINRPAVPKPEGVPLDLIASALSESEEWARNDRVKRLQELYQETGSWDTVRVLLSQQMPN